MYEGPLEQTLGCDSWLTARLDNRQPCNLVPTFQQLPRHLSLLQVKGHYYRSKVTTTGQRSAYRRQLHLSVIGVGSSSREKACTRGYSIASRGWFKQKQKKWQTPLLCIFRKTYWSRYGRLQSRHSGLTAELCSTDTDFLRSRSTRRRQ